ncbi:MAG: DUF6580 family putative transport protein [Candidatus Woesearchaeota archaeon]
MEQLLKLKQKARQESKQSALLKAQLAISTVQKQMQVLKLKEYILMGGFIVGGAVLRALMQPLPSVEPITFIALLTGWMFGSKKGFIVGASSLYISNFLCIGGQGPWTPFQALGFGIAGFLGGLLSRFKLKSGTSSLKMKALILPAMLIAAISTIIYEIIMNAASIPIWGVAAFVTALPFGLIHLISNLSFAAMLPKARNFIDEKLGFSEVPRLQEMLNKLKEKHEEILKV